MNKLGQNAGENLKAGFKKYEIFTLKKEYTVVITAVFATKPKRHRYTSCQRPLFRAIREETVQFPGNRRS